MIECLLRLVVDTHRAKSLLSLLKQFNFVCCKENSQKTIYPENCIIFTESNKEEQKCFCDMAALHRFLNPLPELHLVEETKNPELSEKLAAMPLLNVGGSNKKIHKKWQQCPLSSPSSSMFLPPASYASLPPYPPPITNMTSRTPLPLL